MVLRALIGHFVAYDRRLLTVSATAGGAGANSNRNDGPHSIAAPDGFRG
jgi:hypothetical protein